MNKFASRLPKTNDLSFDFGTFEGFNFRDDSAVERTLTGQEVVNWDHDKFGEAEFWPSGDNVKIAFLFSGKSAVSGTELLRLNDLLSVLDDDSITTFARIHYLISVCGEDLEGLTYEKVEDLQAQVYEGVSFIDLRREAAWDLFELYYPEEYQVWEKSTCDGLIFDTDRFLDSPSWSVEELELGEVKVVIVVGN